MNTFCTRFTVKWPAIDRPPKTQKQSNWNPTTTTSSSVAHTRHSLSRRWRLHQRPRGVQWSPAGSRERGGGGSPRWRRSGYLKQQANKQQLQHVLDSETSLARSPRLLAASSASVGQRPHSRHQTTCIRIISFSLSLSANCDWLTLFFPVLRGLWGGGRRSVNI